MYTCDYGDCCVLMAINLSSISDWKASKKTLATFSAQTFETTHFPHSPSIVISPKNRKFGLVSN